MKEIAVIEDDRDEDNHAPEDNEEECVKWYAFYSEKEGREYYYNPKTRVVTWILPDDAHVEGVAQDKKSGEQSITRRVSFCSNDSDNEDDEYRDDSSEGKLDTPLKDKDDTLYPNQKSRGLSMSLEESSGEHQLSQSKTSSNEKSRNGTGIVVMCAVVLTAGILVFQHQHQHQHQQQNLVNNHPIMKEHIVEVPIPPPLPSPPHRSESSVDMNSKDYQLSKHSDSLKHEITADETTPDAVIVENNASPQADAKRAEDNGMAELNKEDDMITSDQLPATTSEKTNDISEIDADSPREKSSGTAMSEAATMHETNAARNSKVISIEVGDGLMKDSTTQKIRLEIEVDVVGTTPQNEKEIHEKESDIVNPIISHEKEESAIEEDKEAKEEENSNSNVLLESQEITVEEEMEENHGNISETEHKAVEEELPSAKDLPVEKSPDEENHESTDEKEDSTREGTTQSKEDAKEEESHNKTFERNHNDAETTDKAKRIAAERIVQELSPMMKNTAKIGTFEDFVAQNEVMLMKKKTNNKGRSGCLVPFAHLISKKCRNFIKEKPVFDLKGLVDSMLQ